jgi:hypothetical protein
MDPIEPKASSVGRNILLLGALIWLVMVVIPSFFIVDTPDEELGIIGPLSSINLKVGVYVVEEVYKHTPDQVPYVGFLPPPSDVNVEHTGTFNFLLKDYFNSEDKELEDFIVNYIMSVYPKDMDRPNWFHIVFPLDDESNDFRPRPDVRNEGPPWTQPPSPRRV